MIADEIISKYKENRDKKILADVLKEYNPLVESTVTRYSTSGIPAPILKGEAQLLLVDAMDTYNEGNGHFATHASNYLKGMNRMVNNASPIYMPQERANKVKLFLDTQEKMEKKLRRPPTKYELADELKWNATEVERMSQETKRRLLVGGEIEGELKNAFFDKDATIEFVRNRLSEKEQTVLDYTFGIHGKRELPTNARIAQEMGISQTMVRKIKDKIIKNIREYA